MKAFDYVELTNKVGTSRLAGRVQHRASSDPEMIAVSGLGSFSIARLISNGWSVTKFITATAGDVEAPETKATNNGGTV